VYTRGVERCSTFYTFLNVGVSYVMDSQECPRREEPWAHSGTFITNSETGVGSVAHSFTTNSETGVYSSARPCSTLLSVAGLCAFLHWFSRGVEEDYQCCTFSHIQKEKIINVVHLSLTPGITHRCARRYKPTGGAGRE